MKGVYYMKCKDCKDKLKCSFYMNDYPGGNPFSKKKYCEKKEYKVGDWIWLIESISELNRKPGMFKNEGLDKPIRKKIISIVQSSTGTSYQVKGGYHVHENLFGEVAFDNEEDAIDALEERRQNMIDRQMSINDVNVGDVLIHTELNFRVVCVHRDLNDDYHYSVLKAIDEDNITFHIPYKKYPLQISTSHCGIIEIRHDNMKEWFVAERKKYNISTHLMIEVNK